VTSDEESQEVELAHLLNHTVLAGPRQEAGRKSLFLFFILINFILDVRVSG
jgi:hypothetical protein